VNCAEPPILGHRMLWLFLPEDQLQTIRGDLDEEFATFVLPSVGTAAARKWYMRQVWNSLPYSFSLRCCNTEIPQTLLAAYVGFLVPIALLNALRSYVLSQIPLKADSLRSTEFLISSLVLGTFATFLSGLMLPGNRRSVVFRTSCFLSLLSLVMALLVVGFSGFLHLGWYPCGVLILGPVGVLLGGKVATRLSAKGPALE
jgi:hypothetical protein